MSRESFASRLARHTLATGTVRPWGWLEDELRRRETTALPKWPEESLFLKTAAGGDKILQQIATLSQASGQAHGVFNIQPIGLSTCECGRDPSRGIHCKDVVEYLFSLAKAFPEMDGEGHSRLIELTNAFERVAYNALAAANSSPNSSHRCFQRVNQHLSNPTNTDTCGHHDSTHHNSDADPLLKIGNPQNHDCPRHDAWYALMNRLWIPSIGSDESIPHFKAMVLAPCVLTSEGISCRMQTRYPFDDAVHLFLAEGSCVSLDIPIPYWCTALLLDGSPVPFTASSFFRVTLTTLRPSLVLRLPFSVRIEDRPPHGVSVYAGPLLFALPFDSHSPSSPWNFAVDLSSPLILTHRPVITDHTSPSTSSSSSSSSSSTLPAWSIQATGRMDPKWTLSRPAPSPHLLGDPQPLLLVPYASSSFHHVAEFPFFLSAAVARSGL